MLYTKNDNYTIYRASCLDVMDSMEENSIDCIVTDPPYEIGFMNKGWDNTGVAFDVNTWKKALRVLKPGGYLLAFNHSRTFHRMAVAIEDAGFELRDTMLWLYGQGFPKSQNVAKAIEGKLTHGSSNTKDFHKLQGDRIDSKIGYSKMAKDQGARPANYDDRHQEVINVQYTTEEAKQWDGWGSALKPAFEPIVMARKPFKGSVAENVLRYGVGGINIDECRVGDGNHSNGKSGKTSKAFGDYQYRIDKEIYSTSGEYETKDVNGRFPANIIHDGSEEATRNMWDWETDNDASRYFYTAKASVKDRDEGLSEFESKIAGCMTGKEYRENKPTNHPLRKNIHPTVKPTDLMQYLVRLVAPKGATVMDIFMGSGSTGKATMIENVERNANYHFIGIDLDEDENGNPLGYCEIAQARIEWGLHFKEIAEAEAEQSILYDDDGTIKVVKQEKLF